MASGVSIQYGDFAPGAKESFLVNDLISEKDLFGTANQILEDGLRFVNYENPCDGYSVLLDGSGFPLPNNASETAVGFWSVPLSSDFGEFDSNIVFTLQSEYGEQFSSKGLTFSFDTDNVVYPKNISVQWYLDSQQIANENFTCDSSFFFAEKSVENFNRLVISFQNLNMPNSRLKIRSIDFGYGTTFFGDELRAVKISQATDPISSEIKISTCDFVLDSNRKTEFSFQNGQPISVFFNDELHAKTFVKKSKRKSKTIWEVSTEDWIGTLANTPFDGGIYENKNAVELIGEIFSIANVPYSVDDVFLDKVVSGWIPAKDCRDSLLLVCFAIGAVVNTSKSDVILIEKQKTTISQTIPLSRILQGQSFDGEQKPTGIEISAHKYKAVRRGQKTIYDARESGFGNGIKVTFTEPMHGLLIGKILEDEDGEYFVSDGNFGQIISNGANFANVNISKGGVLVGYPYEHTVSVKRMENPLMLAGETENVVKIETATLVSDANIDEVLERCYNYLVKKNSFSMRVVEGKHENELGGYDYDKTVNIGDLISAETEFLGVKSGTIVEQKYSLAGGIIVKDVKVS